MFKIFIFVIAIAIANASVTTGYNTYSTATPSSVLTPTTGTVQPVILKSASEVPIANPYETLVNRMTTKLGLSETQSQNAKIITDVLHTRLSAAIKGPNHRLAAYLIATAYSDNNLLTTPEALQTDEKKRRIQESYVAQGFQGRGFVHFTGAFNYNRFARFVKVNINIIPNNLENPQVAADVFVYGALNGKFTGEKIEKFIPAEGDFDFVRARRSINGDIRANEIAKLAQEILA